MFAVLPATAGLSLGKSTTLTAPVVGYRLHLCWKEISSIKFDHFCHNIILFTRTSQSCLKCADLFDAARSVPVHLLFSFACEVPSLSASSISPDPPPIRGKRPSQ